MSVRLHEPVLPVVGPERPLERHLELQAGGDPVQTWPLPAAGPG